MRRLSGWSKCFRLVAESRLHRASATRSVLPQLLDQGIAHRALTIEENERALFQVGLRYRLLVLLDRLHGLPVYFHDDIAMLQAGRVGGTAHVRSRDKYALDVLHVELFERHFIQRLHSETNPVVLALAARRVGLGRRRRGFHGIGGHLLRLDADFEWLAIADDIESDLLAYFSFDDLVLNVLGRLYFHAVDRDDDIGGTQRRNGSRCVGMQHVHDDLLAAAVEVFLQILVHAEKLEADTNPGTGNFSAGDQLPGNIVGHVDGNGEPDVRAQSADERVHADYFAVNVDQRTAAVAGIDLGVGLDVVLVRCHAEAGAVFLADHADGHGVIQAVRRTDGNGEFTDADLVGIPKAHGGEILSIHLDHGNVGLVIDALHGGGECSSITQAYRDLGGVLDHVVIRQNITVLAENET